MEKQECTTLFLDVRNFTHLMQYNEDNEKFYKLIKSIYDLGTKFVSSFSPKNDYYINSTGDGFVCIFFGESSEIRAFLTALLLQKHLEPLFDNFKPLNKEYQEEDNKKEIGAFYFGLGIESGFVEKISSDDNRLETYLGNVINMAARIESLSKEHGRAPILYGPVFNENIVMQLFGKSYKSLMEIVKERTPNVKELHKEMTDINERLLSSYINEHKIKGAEGFVPVFRVSPSLLKLHNYEVDIIKKTKDFLNFMIFLQNYYDIISCRNNI